MAELPDEVMPGELISSEWINSLLAKLGELDTKVQQLSGSIGSGTVTVPNVFGQTLATARAIIILPAQQLALGVVFDAFGNMVNPLQPSKGTLRVIGQIPAAGAKVNPGTAMSLVVAATPSATPAPPAKPVINALAPTVPLPVGSQVEIKGAGFDSTGSNNIVTFDGVLAAGGPNSDSNSGSLKGVIVPTGIDGAPTAAGQANKPNVPIVVVSFGVASEQFMCTIAPPPPVPLSNISLITPSPAFPDNQMTITGTGFGAQANQNLVEFDNKPALRVQGSTPSQPAGSPPGTLRFNVTVPSASSLAVDTTGADRLNVPIAVVVNGVKGNTTTTRIKNPVV